ncbi:hypothetical protein CANMA_000557 [Candida margitis]|uniref:uncharacterized protein n=1 Tax=Candida margitis TaxID=1775924 RepID=UPI0022266BC1|nr:uncharacterized protein CANMA_000557 [Candida margitis]KAI5970394.1 hypothetical protein CANMA_000557 [Candida margitis]
MIKSCLVNSSRRRLFGKITERIRWSSGNFQIQSHVTLRTSSSLSYLNWVLNPVKQLLNHNQTISGHDELDSLSKRQIQRLDKLIEEGNYTKIIELRDTMSLQEISYVIEQLIAPFSCGNNICDSLPYEFYRNLDPKPPHWDSIVRIFPLLQQFVQDTTAVSDKLGSQMVYIYYHTNQLDKITEAFTSIAHPDEKTIAYFLNSFIVNYEMETFKVHFSKQVISSTIKLSSRLFELLVEQLIPRYFLFENLFYCYQVWVNSPKCEDPTPKSVSLILGQFYKFGTTPEIKEFKRMINKKYGSHYLVQSIVLQNEIINREYLSFKKTITDEDYALIESLVPTEEMEEFCYSWLSFLIRFSNMDGANRIIKLYREKTGQDIPPRYFALLMEYYERNDQFDSLIKFIERGKSSIPYKDEYLTTIVKTFVYSYSRFSPMMVDAINRWMGDPHHFQLHKVASQFYPYHLVEPFNYRKYKGWSALKFKGNERHNKQQVRFRVEYGFPDLLERGLAPDFKEVLDTFRMGDLDDRLYLKSVLTKTRQYNLKNQKTLELRSLKHFSLTREDLSRYFRSNKNCLNDSQKFYFVRMLLNFGLLKEADYLLALIDSLSLNDKNKMTKFILEMRLCSKRKQFDQMVSVLDKFSLAQIYPSPYLLMQSLYLESSLANMQRSRTSLPKEQLESLNACLRKLRGFIGDAKQVLKRDEEEVPHLVEKTIRILDDWRNNNTRNRIL